uniref:Uncharacterized protein n=1 Tax=Siphoviridae sp. ctZHD14 TaxID=2827891 RepID=A0A8S5SX86_9CAUD|nr:MAG TPA: hypothetical protein [Siphoviridae sp. ctZHD14]
MTRLNLYVIIFKHQISLKLSLKLWDGLTALFSITELAVSERNKFRIIISG